MDLQTLERRITELEDIEAIKQLKQRYLYACDERDADAVQCCFCRDEVLIDFGFIGRFTQAKDFVDVFVQMTQSPYHLDQHYGIAPIIQVHDPEHASGRWRIHFQLLDSEKGVAQFMGGYYADQYVKQDGQWAIRESVYTISTNLMMQKDSAGLLQAVELGALHAIATEID